MDYIDSILDMIRRENPAYEFKAEGDDPFTISYREAGGEWILFGYVEDRFIRRAETVPKTELTPEVIESVRQALLVAEEDMKEYRRKSRVTPEMMKQVY